MTTSHSDRQQFHRHAQRILFVQSSHSRYCHSYHESSLDLDSFTSFNAIHVAELSFTAGLVLSRTRLHTPSFLELKNLRTLSLEDGQFKSVTSINFQSEHSFLL